MRAVPRLPRAVALVLAGSLMGGEITKAVTEVRAKGVLVVSLNCQSHPYESSNAWHRWLAAESAV